MKVLTVTAMHVQPLMAAQPWRSPICCPCDQGKTIECKRAGQPECGQPARDRVRLDCTNRACTTYTDSLQAVCPSTSEVLVTGNRTDRCQRGHPDPESTIRMPWQLKQPTQGTGHPTVMMASAGRAGETAHCPEHQTPTARPTRAQRTRRQVVHRRAGRQTGDRKSAGQVADSTAGAGAPVVIAEVALHVVEGRLDDLGVGLPGELALHIRLQTLHEDGPLQLRVGLLVQLRHVVRLVLRVLDVERAEGRRDAGDAPAFIDKVRPCATSSGCTWHAAHGWEMQCLDCSAARKQTCVCRQVTTDIDGRHVGAKKSRITPVRGCLRTSIILRGKAPAWGSDEWQVSDSHGRPICGHCGWSVAYLPYSLVPPA